MVHRIKLGDQIYFYKNKINKSEHDQKNQPAVYVEKRFDKYGVYRSYIMWSRYGKKFEVGNGWNLYQDLSLNQAISAAKQALKYLK